MNIFISWSGDLSNKIAKVIKDWIPTVLQSVKPYFTPDDIEKGAKWESEITKKLNESNIGIICLTPENTKKPWILFEAGALSSKLDKSRVCPLLFGLSNANLTGPLSTFQTTVFEKMEFKKLMQSINENLGDRKISDKIFDEVFETFYPKLEAKVSELLEAHKSITQEEDSIKVERSDREILELTRRQYGRPDRRHKMLFEDLTNNDIGFVHTAIMSYMEANNFRLKEYSELDEEKVYEQLSKEEDIRDAIGNQENLRRVIAEFINK